jgi:hypothetical protein
MRPLACGKQSWFATRSGERVAMVLPFPSVLQAVDFGNPQHSSNFYAEHLIYLSCRKPEVVAFCPYAGWSSPTSHTLEALHIAVRNLFDDIRSNQSGVVLVPTHITYETLSGTFPPIVLQPRTASPLQSKPFSMPKMQMNEDSYEYARMIAIIKRHNHQASRTDKRRCRSTHDPPFDHCANEDALECTLAHSNCVVIHGCEKHREHTKHGSMQ